MKTTHIPQTANFKTGKTSFQLLTGSILSLATWIIALLFTLLSVTFQLVWRVGTGITRLSFRCIVYMLLGTIFLCSVILLGILSIITLGAISLP